MEKTYNILIIAPYFAPYIGVGAARITSLSAYLAEIGWNVTVLTFDPSGYALGEKKREIPCGISYKFFENAVHWEDSLWALVKSNLGTEEVDICLYTVGPYDFMKRLHKIRTLFRVPYVIDYRDLWLLSERMRDPELGKIARMKIWLMNKLNSPIEERAVKNADGIVCVTEKDAEAMRKHYCIQNKVHTIYNGFEIVHEENTPIYMTSKYSVLVTGKMAYYNYEQARNIIDAVDNLRNEGIDISIYHIGNYEENIITYAKDACRSAKTYIFCGLRNYEETLGAISKATVCYIAHKQYSGLGTKVYDYIAKNKPIIYAGVVPSELSQFISSFNNGFVANDVGCQGDIIKKIIRENITQLSNNITRDYSRASQNRRYAELLKEIIENR